jgi:hypothetical protein
VAVSQRVRNLCSQEVTLYQSRIFGLSLLLCLALGTICILIAIHLRSSSEEPLRQELMFRIGRLVTNGPASQAIGAKAASAQDTVLSQQLLQLLQQWPAPAHLGADLIRDLGIALLIGVFVTFAIERYSSERLRQSVTYDVLSSAYAQLVPEEIFSQIVDVFKSDVWRRNWHVVIETNPVDPGKGIAIINSTISYDVENLKEHPIDFLLRGHIDADIILRGITLQGYTAPSVAPWYTQITVTYPRNRIDVSASNQSAMGVLDGTPYANGELRIELKGEQLGFEVPVVIPARKSVSLTCHLRRAVRVPGSFVLYATTPAAGIRITTAGDDFAFTVIPLHPNREALRHEGSDWFFDYGILPWQGFQLRSMPNRYNVLS